MEGSKHKEKNQKLLSILGIIAPYFIVVGFIALPWFLKSGYLFLTDMAWGPNIILDWNSSWFFFYALIKLLSFVFSVAFLEKMSLAGALLLILLGGRMLVAATICKAYKEKPSSDIAFVLGLFALFNPFVYDRLLYGQLGVLLSLGFTLLAGAYLISAEQHLNWRHFCLAVFFGALALPFSVHFAFILFPLY